MISFSLSFFRFSLVSISFFLFKHPLGWAGRPASSVLWKRTSFLIGKWTISETPWGFLLLCKWTTAETQELQGGGLWALGLGWRPFFFPIKKIDFFSYEAYSSFANGPLLRPYEARSSFENGPQSLLENGPSSTSTPPLSLSHIDTPIQSFIEICIEKTA